jgi:hypothetical protein
MKKYIIIELPTGKMLELTTKKKNFLQLLADAKEYIESKKKKVGVKAISKIIGDVLYRNDKYDSRNRYDDYIAKKIHKAVYGQEENQNDIKEDRMAGEIMNEAQAYSKYADIKSELTNVLARFARVCIEQDRNVREEIEDCICDADGDNEWNREGEDEK